MNKLVKIGGIHNFIKTKNHYKNYPIANSAKFAQ